MVFNDGFVHCDPHPGNIIIRPNNKGYPYNFELVLLDHGLYRQLSPGFRLQYARLWRSLLEGDKEKIQKESYDLTGTDLYMMLSSIVTGQSWYSIESGNLTKSNVNVQFEQSQLVGVKDSFFAELSRVMSSIPRDLVLLIKTNDLIRLIDRSLYANLPPKSQARACTKSWLILSLYSLSTLKSNAISSVENIRKSMGILGGIIYSIKEYIYIYIDYTSLEIPIRVYYAWLKFLEYKDFIVFSK
ncbi:hypothetical protein BB559_003300 [Furculomyces boomerangus]|uniref:ABC1 atypical kinase-like domain-containing protein n=3 Tax=Harpellales TaxID=61421 RepID=A0A2T9YM47_9FUNG|nr:hypothetical protein BB559_003300 [Furculomyces boomerangus]